MDWSVWGGEDLLVAPVERVEVDVFDRLRVLVVAVEFSSALGLPDVGPGRGAVAGGGEPAGFDERLEQCRV